MAWATKALTLLRWAAFVAAGAACGVGLFTLHYARATSYLSDDPAACVNCHVMRDNYDAWAVSSHRGLTCNECHVPHGIITKWLAKAENGYHHSYAFTFADVQVIRAKEKSRAVVNANCAACHERETFNLAASAGGAPPSCLACHRGAGHVF
jgi:cytochrome c nitrite reductase small subunit